MKLQNQSVIFPLSTHFSKCSKLTSDLEVLERGSIRTVGYLISLSTNYSDWVVSAIRDVAWVNSTRITRWKAEIIWIYFRAIFFHFDYDDSIPSKSRSRIWWNTNSLSAHSDQQGKDFNGSNNWNKLYSTKCICFIRQIAWRECMQKVLMAKMIIVGETFAIFHLGRQITWPFTELGLD